MGLQSEGRSIHSWVESENRHIPVLCQVSSRQGGAREGPPGTLIICENIDIKVNF